MNTENQFTKLAAIDVGKKIEKKNGLSYLSWAWAVHELLSNDPRATWSYREPQKWNDTVMVFCTVNAFGKEMTAQLPVMDHRNKAIPNPDAFQVNVAMQRCLAKAIGLHGIGLYIYAGEDLPLDDNTPQPQQKPATPKETPKAPPAASPAPDFIPMTATTAKMLRFYATSPKTQAMVEKVIATKELVGVDDFSEELAQKTVSWIESEMAKRGEKSA